LLNDERADTFTGVALSCVGLDRDTAVQLRGVVALVLLWVGRMDSVALRFRSKASQQMKVCPLAARTTSLEMRNECAMDRALGPGPGERRSSRDKATLDAAPVVDTLPISSWLKHMMTFTFAPSGRTFFD